MIFQLKDHSSFYNRLVFILSLLGLSVSAFLWYEYNVTGPIYCPVGGGCDLVRASSYSSFLGIPIPVLGLAFYLAMAVLSVVRTERRWGVRFAELQMWLAVLAVSFGIYLTYLEIFVIKAICFWCVLSFIISLTILLSVISGRQTEKQI